MGHSPESAYPVLRQYRDFQSEVRCSIEAAVLKGINKALIARLQHAYHDISARYIIGNTPGRCSCFCYTNNGSPNRLSPRSSGSADRITARRIIYGKSQKPKNGFYRKKRCPQMVSFAYFTLFHVRFLPPSVSGFAFPQKCLYQNGGRRRMIACDCNHFKSKTVEVSVMWIGFLFKSAYSRQRHRLYRIVRVIVYEPLTAML